MKGETLYTWGQLEAAACMWEYVLDRMRRAAKAGLPTPWDDYRDGYGTVQLRCTVIRHAPELLTAYEAALANKYQKDFDRDFIPQYMEEYVTRILT